LGFSTNFNANFHLLLFLDLAYLPSNYILFTAECRVINRFDCSKSFLTYLISHGFVSNQEANKIGIVNLIYLIYFINQKRNDTQKCRTQDFWGERENEGT